MRKFEKKNKESKIKLKRKLITGVDPGGGRQPQRRGGFVSLLFGQNFPKTASN